MPMMKFRDIASDHVITLRANNSTEKAMALMEEHNIRHLPVVMDHDLVGIVSDRDVRKSFFLNKVDDLDGDESRFHRKGRAEVQDIMIQEVRTAQLSETLMEVADRMTSHKIGALPVTEGQDLVGIITETDMLQALAAAFDA